MCFQTHDPTYHATCARSSTVIFLDIFMLLFITAEKKLREAWFISLFMLHVIRRKRYKLVPDVFMPFFIRRFIINSSG